jgi:hypothetical protein
MPPIVLKLKGEETFSETTVHSQVHMQLTSAMNKINTKI